MRDFLNDVLSEGEDITHFEYTKKNNRDKGPALVGLELQSKDGYARLLKRMQATGINYEELRGNRDLFELLV